VYQASTGGPELHPAASGAADRLSAVCSSLQIDRPTVKRIYAIAAKHPLKGAIQRKAASVIDA